ncbi:MAG: D-Ala-D-Ala carboxypeptidase family metallohydrolase [Fusobacteriaceae bacterium]
MKKTIYFISVLGIMIFLTSCSSLKTPHKNRKVSKHFTMGEAIRENIKIDREIERNIYYTADRMEDFRKLLGQPLTVLSWYRSPKSNKIAGGAKKSSHLKALAVDFRTENSALQNYKKIINSKLSYDLIIYYKKLNMIHLGFRENKDDEKKLKLLR